MQEKEITYIRKNIDLFCCPKCSGGLLCDVNDLVCSSCTQRYSLQETISSLYWQNEWDSSKEDVTDTIHAFYEKNPFPNYDDFDSVSSLIDKARKGLFAQLLDDQIPYGARVLECGCGTGQLTNFLSVANRNVIGTDICMNSLRLAQDFKDRNSLENAHFFQMNLFRPCFKPGSFDLVILNGVLHHTSDPFLAFKSIASLVKQEGYILVGLYHKYGRLVTDIRRFIFRISNDSFRFLDRHAVDKKISEAKRRAWFADQYKNPHESKHTVTEVMGWLHKTGFEFVFCIPKTIPFDKLKPGEPLFKPYKLGNYIQRALVNFGMVFSGCREGGFFIVIAKKTGIANQ